MSKDEMDADEVFNSMQKRQRIQDEFEKLRPNPKGFYVGFACMFLAAGFCMWLYPDITQSRIPLIVLIFTFGIGGVLNREIQRIDSRIDALQRLLKDDL